MRKRDFRLFSPFFFICFSLRTEFDLERDMLINETLPKLQQFFLTQGVYVNFVDCNLNWDSDLARNPYHVVRLTKELDDAYRTSTGLFLIVSEFLVVLVESFDIFSFRFV